MAGRKIAWSAAEVEQLYAALEHCLNVNVPSKPGFYRVVAEQLTNSRPPSSELPSRTPKQVRRKSEIISKESGQEPGAYLESLMKRRQRQSSGREETPNQDTEQHNHSESSLTSLLDTDYQVENDSPAAQATKEAQPEENYPIEPEVQAQRDTGAIGEFGNLFQTLQKWSKDKGFKPPPDHDTVRESVAIIMQELDSGIERFMKCHPVSGATPSNLTKDAIKLSGLFFCRIPEARLKIELNTLFGLTSTEVIFRMYAAAALYTWVLLDFEDSTPSQYLPSYEHVDAFDREAPELLRKLKIVSRVRYLKEVVRPQLPAFQRKYQEDLFNVFVSLSSQGQWEPPQDTFSRQATYNYRHEQNLQWIRIVESAFHKALDLKIRLEVSSRSYYFAFPNLHEEFDKKCMRAAHTLHAVDGPQGSKVCVCLQPAVFSRNRERWEEEPINVVKAVVVIQGYPVQWNMI